MEFFGIWRALVKELSLFKELSLRVPNEGSTLVAA